MSAQDNVTQDHIKRAMACFGTGVTVITTHHAGQDWGMTCNSFNTVSLDPAMVLWSIKQSSSSHSAFVNATGYTVNILSLEQHDLAMRFTKGAHSDRFAGLKLARLTDQRPRIEGALAWFDCSLHRAIAVADHDIMLGHILSCGTSDDKHAQPLLYAQRQFGSFKPWQA
jgi:flavin reductase (DIM6/NTAB) family NADH-FMN oxidoreductase RutF